MLSVLLKIMSLALSAFDGVTKYLNNKKIEEAGARKQREADHQAQEEKIKNVQNTLNDLDAEYDELLALPKDKHDK